MKLYGSFFFLVVGRNGEIFATIHIAAAVKTKKKRGEKMKKREKRLKKKKKMNSYTLFSMCG